MSASARPIYLDYNATTPLDQRVLDSMMPWLTGNFGNAASRTHLYGWEAAEAVATARQQVARILGATEKEIVFTSGATESNNLALKGAFEALGASRKHIITVATEHKAVLDTCQHLEAFGAEVTYLLPDSDGLICPEQVQDALRPDTLLVSVMYANNEIGVIQPIIEIGSLCRKAGVLFHTDATQAVGKVPIDVQHAAIDLLSLSAHKLYGPKGVGALYVRKGISLTAQLDGGRHERGLRSGTLNVPGIVGLGVACALAQKELAKESTRLTELRNTLENNLINSLLNTQINGHRTQRLPQTTNISFGGLDGEELLMSLHRLAVSNGSACTSASVEPSFVLKALGLPDDLAHASIRFSLGRFTTSEDIDLAIGHILEVVSRIRNGA
ncbi:cysteine desulfurase family protein [Arundinibacter roseus]|uniref:cysteine desulfurase n=1 Tax=Arundinibacter roseus TaxID=2070510 RepID=A0A4R4KDX1_9BACT|nr:IscS subfamily cysteine desulfurase [Arundinibacter roseus]TDB65863.1 aminotransferase class V-fold PLP-dependent enzyme [Arundinibacter roseus]